MERIDIRPLQQEDSIPMFLLRTSDDVARVSFNPPPTMAMHKVFILETLAGKKPPIYVATVDGYFAGSCRVGYDACIDIMVAAPYRHKGIASLMLQYLQGIHDKLVALVKQDNTVALALFIKCGFVPTPEVSHYRVLAWFKEEEV